MLCSPITLSTRRWWGGLKVFPFTFFRTAHQRMHSYSVHRDAWWLALSFPYSLFALPAVSCLSPLIIHWLSSFPGHHTHRSSRTLLCPLRWLPSKFDPATLPPSADSPGFHPFSVFPTDFFADTNLGFQGSICTTCVLKWHTFKMWKTLVNSLLLLHLLRRYFCSVHLLYILL